jgi:hypothetical protein
MGFEYFFSNFFNRVSHCWFLVFLYSNLLLPHWASAISVLLGCLTAVYSNTSKPFTFNAIAYYNIGKRSDVEAF